MLANKKMSLFHYTWPIFIELLLQMLVGNVDQMMMSQVSQNAVGAIGNANQIMNVLIIMFTVISLATTILVSQYFGAQDYHRVSETYTLAVVVNLVFGLVIGAILVFFGQPIFIWMQVPNEILNDCVLYVTLVGIGVPFQALYLSYSAMFRTQGWMKETMLISGIMNAINIIGNFILILGFGPIPALGIAGAAISSSVSRFIGLILLMVVFNIKTTVHVDLKTLSPFPWSTLKKLLAIGIPSGGENISYNVSQMVITKMVNPFGTAVINTRVYGNMFAMISYLYGSAVSSAAQILVGYQIGAKKLDDAHIQVKKTLVYSIAVGLVVSITLYIFAVPLFGLFTQDPTVIALGKQILFIDIFLEVGRAVNMTLVRSLQAAGDINFPIVLGIISEWAVSILFSWLFAIVLGWGLVGVWIAMTIDEGFRAILFLFRWFGGKWRKMNLIEE